LVQPRNIEGLHFAKFKDIPLIGHSGTSLLQAQPYLPYIPVISDDLGGELNNITEITPLDVLELYNYGDNIDLLDVVRVIAPTSKPTKGPLWSFEQPSHIKTISKLKLAEYPLRSRPVLTKLVFADLNAVTNRMEGRVNYIKVPTDTAYETINLAKFCYRSDWREVAAKWDYLTYDDAATREWLSHRSGIPQIDKELNILEAEGLMQHSLNKLNVHTKLESLLKSKPILQFREQQVRIIVWQEKAVAAIFSPIFIAAKKRLKELLRPEIIYSDGYTPAELSQRLSHIKSEGLMYLEDDGNKQDARTPHAVLDVEFSCYVNHLKVSSDVVGLWAECHHLWRYKGKFLRGTCDAMRQTGQATTAIGNTYTNLIVHWRMIREIGNGLKLMLILGDDNLTLTSSFINVQAHKKRCKEKFNMIQEATLNSNFGSFLQTIVSSNLNGSCQLSPDYVRLNNRWEWTNGVSNNPVETIEARGKSYLSMIGKTKEAEQINHTCQWNLDLQEYYNPTATIAAMMHKYGMSREAAIEQYYQLIAKVGKRDYAEQKFTMFTSQQF
jgi:hypothetical protein